MRAQQDANSCDSRSVDPKKLAIIAGSWSFIFITVTHSIPFRIEWPLTHLFDPFYSFLNIKYIYGMFSQIPRENIELSAVVTLKSGTQVNWTSPTDNLKALPLGKRAVSERYRKFLHDVIWRGDELRSYLYPDTARFIAHQVERPGDPATTVELYALTKPIVMPNEQALPVVRKTVFVYSLAEQRLIH